MYCNIIRSSIMASLTEQSCVDIAFFSYLYIHSRTSTEPIIKTTKFYKGNKYVILRQIERGCFVAD